MLFVEIKSLRNSISNQSIELSNNLLNSQITWKAEIEAGNKVKWQRWVAYLHTHTHTLCESVCIQRFRTIWRQWRPTVFECIKRGDGRHWSRVCVCVCIYYKLYRMNRVYRIKQKPEMIRVGNVKVENFDCNCRRSNCSNLIVCSLSV